jgi:hypothetical protein
MCVSMCAFYPPTQSRIPHHRHVTRYFVRYSTIANRFPPGRAVVPSAGPLNSPFMTLAGWLTEEWVHVRSGMADGDDGGTVRSPSMPPPGLGTRRQRFLRFGPQGLDGTLVLVRRFFNQTTQPAGGYCLLPLWTQRSGQSKGRVVEKKIWWEMQDPRVQNPVLV